MYDQTIVDLYGHIDQSYPIPNTVYAFRLSLLFSRSWSAKVRLFLQELFSVHTVFWMFAAVCFVALIFTQRCVIETSGKTLAEIQDLLAADSRDVKTFANEKKLLSFDKILCHPVSPKACAKSTRSSSVEEQSRDLIDNCADV